jgi:hypothetical protein
MHSNKLQILCRHYLESLKQRARRHGLCRIVCDLIDANKREECKASENDVEMLARLCNDDRIARKDIPKVLGKPYNQCFNDDDFKHIRKVVNRNSYSKISTLMYAEDLKFEKTKYHPKKNG